MFTLKYKITDDDIKKVNKGIMWKYFALYTVVALFGLGVGIAATVLRPRTEMLVFGIILIVLGAILLGCSILLTVSPKTFVVSALLTDAETERELTVDKDGITVRTDGHSDIYFRMGEISKVKPTKTGLLLYIGREQVLIVKDAITSGQTIAELAEFIKTNTSGKSAPKPQPAEASVKTEAEKNETENAEAESSEKE